MDVNWPTNFIKRHSELHKQKQKPLVIERKRSHDPAVILNWFHRLRKVRSTWSILDDDIYNMDETGYVQTVDVHIGSLQNSLKRDNICKIQITESISHQLSVSL